MGVGHVGADLCDQWRTKCLPGVHVLHPHGWPHDPLNDGAGAVSSWSSGDPALSGAGSSQGRLLGTQGVGAVGSSHPLCLVYLASSFCRA